MPAVNMWLQGQAAGIRPAACLRESLTNIYNNRYKNETFKIIFILTILPYGQSGGRIGVPYRAHAGKNGLPAGMTGHMDSPRVRRR